MCRIIPFISLLLLISTQTFASDSVKIMISTQVFHCDLDEKLHCQAISQIQQEEFLLKKDGGRVQLEDKEHGLNADIVTSLDNNNVIYDMTLCSSESCTMSTINSDSNGNINQSMSGQYNLTQKSFYVLLFFITNQVNSINVKEHFLKVMPH